MARTISAGGMLDIRSAALLQDIQLAAEVCGQAQITFKQRRYYSSVFFRDLPPYADPKNPDLYDQSKHWIVTAAAFVICFLILGLINTLPLLHSSNRLKYGIGDVEIVVISAATYGILVLVGPLAACSVRSIGNRLTCMFGLLLFFFGVILDGLQLDIFVYYIAHFFLMGFGGSFALTGAVSSVVRFFRKKLQFALAIIVCACPVGTIFFSLVLYFLSTHTALGYTWTLISISFLVLISIGLTHLLPTSIRPPRHPDPFYVPKKQREVIKECITNSATSETQIETCDPEKEEISAHKSCLCVCICDISILTDLPFMLWAAVTCAAMLSLYIPYLFFYFYVVVDLGLESWDGICLIIWFCIASLAARIGIQLDSEHTFMFNRTLFQIAIIGSGILYIFLSHAETFGWLLVWCMIMGALEGIFIGVIPRVTLSTIPRRHMVSSWTYIVLMHGIALFIGSYIIIAIRQSTGGDISFACIILAIIHITAGIFSFFLPNEEDLVEDYEEEAMRAMSIQIKSASDGFPGGNGSCECEAEAGATDETRIQYPEFIPRIHPMMLVSNSFCCGTAEGCSEYSTNCPICSKAGPTPGCLEPNPCLSNKPC